MIKIDLETVSKEDAYKWLTSTVIPRPIALVTTTSASGVVNVAPFSYFNIVTASPARLSIVIGKKAGALKDTARNIFETKKFVVHVVTEANLEDTNLSASKIPYHQSELTITHFTVSKNDRFEVPHLNQSPVYFECVLDKHVAFEDSDMIIGKAIHMHVDESLLTEGRINIQSLKPIGRLSKNDYVSLGNIITLKRPE